MNRNELAGTGRTHPPFEQGNGMAVTHGARSERLLRPLARDIEQRARSMPDWPPHLAGATRYDDEVAAWCWAEAVCTRLRDYLADQDPMEWLTEQDSTDETVEVREGGSRRRSRTKRVQSALEQLRRWESIAGNRRQALGLTPTSAARLARDLMAARHSAGPSLAQQWSDDAEVEE